MIDLTKKVQTIDGRRARILCTDRSYIGEWKKKYGRPSYRVIALVEEKVGLITVEVMKMYTMDGETGCGHDPISENWKDKLINIDFVGPIIARNMI